MKVIESTYSRINLDNLYDNYQEFKKHLEGKKICCVIKANAYGHGYEEVSRQMEEMGVDYFAVSSVQEGILLRKNQIKSPILLLSAPFSGTEDLAIENDIETTVYTYDQAKSLDDAARDLKKIHKIHIKIDTGMNRIGFKPSDEALEDIVKISNLENIELKGIFTHFACADSDSDFTKRQYKDFASFIEALGEKNINFELIHTDNDAGAMAYDHRANMVRLGIGLYGIYPSKMIEDVADIKVKPLMSLISYVTNVKTIEAGETVSYGGTFTAKNKTRIATVGGGYADGVPRLLSNRGSVLIDGKEFPIVGNICMDQFMVDVSGYDIEIGDEVEIFGENLSVNRLADLTGTISYEILSGIGLRVPRLYFKSGKLIGEKWYMFNGVSQE